MIMLLCNTARHPLTRSPPTPFLTTQSWQATIMDSMINADKACEGFHSIEGHGVRKGCNDNVHMYQSCI